MFKALCRIQCTEQEICSVLDVTDKTLNAWCKRTLHLNFSEAYKRESADGKMSIRRAMFEKATKDKNTTMLIWLSKQYLGMTDKVEMDETAVMSRLDSVLNGVKDKVEQTEKE